MYYPTGKRPNFYRRTVVHSWFMPASAHMQTCFSDRSDRTRHWGFRSEKFRMCDGSRSLLCPFPADLHINSSQYFNNNILSPNNMVRGPDINATAEAVSDTPLPATVRTH